MTKVGITGHQKIPTEALDYVTRGISDCLQHVARPVVGYSSLALGADQLFARTVLDLGGDLIAVIPCHGYETMFQSEDLLAYNSLLARSTAVTTLDYPAPSEDAYMAAGEMVIESSDVIIAVWDGKPAAGLGGTGDAVAHARAIGKQVIVVWPEGVSR